MVWYPQIQKPPHRGGDTTPSPLVSKHYLTAAPFYSEIILYIGK